MTRFGEQKDGPFEIQLQAGTWEVRIQADGYPNLFLGQRELQPGSMWDLGDVRLQQGGRLVVQEQGDGKPDYLIVTTAGEFRAGLYSPQPPLRSDPLPPGDYLLLVRGQGIAAMALPFAIRSAEETKLVVDKQPGVRQRIVVVPPNGEVLTGSVWVELRRERALVFSGSAKKGADGAFAAEVWLHPGQYEVTTRDRPAVSRATFTVGEAEADALQLLLR
jgi:hypothetical protein